MRLLLLLLLCSAAAAQAQSFDLSIRNIMRGPELVGVAPERVQFSDDGRWIFFRWKPGGHAWHEQLALYRVSARGGRPERLEERAADSLGVLLATGPKSRDGKTRVVAHDGDIHLIDRATLGVRRLTHTRDIESSPVFSRDGRTIYFVRDSNIFALELTRGTIRQLTDIRTTPAPEDPRAAEGQLKFLEEQQKELFEHVRRETERRAEEERRRKERTARGLKTVHLQPKENVASLAVGEDGRYAMLQTSRADSARRVIMPEWITRSGYTESAEVRSKVGDAQSEAGRVGIVDLGNGDVRWIDVAVKRDTVTAKLAVARFMGWNDEGSAALVGSLSADFKDQWLHTVDAVTGNLTQLAHERNNAWIGGPCDFWIRCAGWLPDNRTVYYASEKDGYSHVYLVNRDGSNERQLTSGPWEVYRVALSPAKDRFYITSNEGTPFEQHFYHMTFDGRRTRITMQAGQQDVSWSPDGSRIAAVSSYANVPPELFVGENRAGAKLDQVTHSPTADWQSYRWIVPPIVHVRASDGVLVPARIYRPLEFGVQPNGAAVIFVHGAGYLQNVHNWWSSYYREYMFHHLLATRGFTVLDIDYRGSQGYGRDWRTAIYRHMGGKDLTDQVDGAKYLVASEGVDANRVGLYGGSYGGFITLMALFTEADHFAAGAALRSVTDWAHYNHGYTARILNAPQEDTLAYRRSSPIYFAEGLRDPLLMAHGMVDSNVHFSDIVRLTQRLIELGKTDWELAVYPTESHAFLDPASWTDEYRRIYELFERSLR